jgi:hypothetical protein
MDSQNGMSVATNSVEFSYKYSSTQLDKRWNIHPTWDTPYIFVELWRDVVWQDNGQEILDRRVAT